MQTTTVRLYSLGYGQAKTYWTAFLFVAGNVLLPQLCHLFLLGGVRWLPLVSARRRSGCLPLW